MNKEKIILKTFDKNSSFKVSDNDLETIYGKIKNKENTKAVIADRLSSQGVSKKQTVEIMTMIATTTAVLAISSILKSLKQKDKVWQQ